jgi:hypothetical protein
MILELDLSAGSWMDVAYTTLSRDDGFIKSIEIGTSNYGWSTICGWFEGSKIHGRPASTYQVYEHVHMKYFR